jgi:hypothetical protein
LSFGLLRPRVMFALSSSRAEWLHPRQDCTMTFPDLLPQAELDRARLWPRLLFPRREHAVAAACMVAVAWLLQLV